MKIERRTYLESTALNHREDGRYEKKRREIFARQRTRIRRARQRRLLLAVVSMIIITFLAFDAFAIRGKAEGKDEQKFKYYTSVKLNYGDTLWKIADQYMDQEHYNHLSFVAEVKSINHIKDENEIVAGKTLIIPYYSSEFVKD